MNAKSAGERPTRTAHPNLQEPGAASIVLRDWLAAPAAYLDATTRVEVIETHISWVFLTDRFAYKLKKPVQFEFLDFSTSERRRDACLQEVELNRRLAPDVYLGVLPVASDSRGRLSLGGAGRPVDWVVKMKRLPAAKALDQLVRSGHLENRDIESLADTLARFYVRLPPLTVRTDAYCRQFEHHIRANEDELSQPVHGFDLDLIRRVHGAQLRFFSLQRDRLVDRVRDGRVVDGHGDLRPEHIYLTPAPTIIDCIEFSAEYRTIDVIDELAFLAMECDRLHADWVGERVLAGYREVSGDRPPPGIVDFFKCYRACVRAKVGALRARQAVGPAAPPMREVAGEYVGLASRYARQIGPPLLLVVRGYSGTGKSTLAATLAEAWGAHLLQTDEVRRELFGGQPTAADYGQGCYTPSNRQLVYEEMFRRAAHKLERGLTVILDGTFLTRDLRSRALQLAADHQAATLLVHCVCPIELAQERIADRASRERSTSDARPEFVALQQEQDEPDATHWPACTVDTTDGLPSVRQAIDERLRTSLGFAGR